MERPLRARENGGDACRRPRLPLTSNPSPTHESRPAPFFALFFCLALRPSPALAANGPCPGSVSFYGQATPGSLNIAPTIDFIGCPQTGDNVTVQIGAGQRGAPTCVLFGSQLSGPIGLDLSSMLLVDPVTDIPVTINGAGTASIDLWIPFGSTFLDEVISVQAVCLDPGSPFGVSATVGMNVAIGFGGTGGQ